MCFDAFWCACGMHTRAAPGEQEAQGGTRVGAGVLSALCATAVTKLCATSTAVTKLCSSRQALTLNADSKQQALTLNADSLWQGGAGEKGGAF